MHELPLVHALAADLDGRLRGRVAARFDLLSFAALKTFDPPVSGIEGQGVRGVTRHGKFLDFAIGDLHLVMHLARAGWVRWNDGTRPTPPRTGKSPLAAQLLLDDGTGLNITEAGTKKSLAIYLVEKPTDVPGIARLGPDPLSEDFTEERFQGILAAAGRAQIKGVLRNQSTIAGIGNAYSDEILHVARMSPFKLAAMTADEAGRLYDAMQTTLREAIARSEGLAASELKKEKKSGMRVYSRTVEACLVYRDTVRQVNCADSNQ